MTAEMLTSAAKRQSDQVVLAKAWLGSSPSRLRQWQAVRALRQNWAMTKISARRQLGLA